MKKLFIVLSAVVLLTGCADGVSLQYAVSMTQVGFLHGLWHGLCAPFSFIGSLFSDNISIYAVYNNGGWYDFGFVMGSGILTFGASK